MKKSREILIIKRAALGDVLRTTSVAAALKANSPCRIRWLTDRQARPLLSGNPLIDQVLIRPAPVFFGRFDLVLSLEEDRACAVFAEKAVRPGGKLVGISWKDGGLRYSADSALYYDMSLLNRDADGGHAKADRLKAANRLTYAQLWLKILGLPSACVARPQLALTAADRRAAGALAKRHGLRGRQAIGFNPGAGARWPSKQVSVGKAVSILAGLRRLGRPVLLLGGRDDAGRNRMILRAAGSAGAPLIDAGAHDVRSFAGVVELCKVLVCTDSLAFHIGTALGKKVVVLVGPTSAAELDVFGSGRKLSSKAGCSCFYRPRCKMPRACLDMIAEEDILRGCQ